MIETINTTTRPLFFNEKIAKKILKNEKVGKQFSARIISDTLGIDYDEVYNNIKLSTDEIAFTALTVGSVADVVYHSDKIYFDIEINGYSGESKERQLESYVYSLELGQLHTYKDYHKVKKVIQISIDLFDFLGHKRFIYNNYLMNYEYHEIVTDKLQIIHINIDYLRRMEYNEVVKTKNKLMKDLYFLICGEKQLEEIIEKSDELMKEVIKEAKQIAAINQMDLYLTEEEMKENDKKHYLEVGRNEGIEKGIEKNRTEMIVNLFNNGASLDLISKSSNLSVEEVKRIIKENSKLEKE